MLVTNLKAHGEEMYGKGMGIDFDEISSRNDSYELTETDLHFLHLMKRKRSALYREINLIKQLATDNLIILPYDDAFELLIKPDGSWELVIADLRYVKVALSKQDAYEQNDIYVSWAISGLELLARKMFALTTLGKIQRRIQKLVLGV